MAEIRRYPFARHLRGDPSTHTLHWRRGRLVASGRGLAFWFRPLSTAVAEVPLDDREAAFLIHGRTADFQDVTVQGVITYRVTAPETLAGRLDFGIDLDTGAWSRTPLEQLAGALTQLAQQLTADHLARVTLRQALAESIDIVRDRIAVGLVADEGLAAMGVAVVAVRVAAVRPTPELERALQTPTLEAVQQGADEATFARRALAVENERAIAENELQNQIELARREELLVAQRGANERRRVEDEAQAQRVAAEGAAERSRLAAAAQADGIRAVEGARVVAEGDRLDAYRDLPVAVVLGLAARELAGKLERIEHLSLSPDQLVPLVQSFLAARTRELEQG
jgi:regulator of protease activity HflC (stomatin/prohibitin superfamily)